MPVRRFLLIVTTQQVWPDVVGQVCGRLLGFSVSAPLAVTETIVERYPVRLVQKGVIASNLDAILCHHLPSEALRISGRLGAPAYNDQAWELRRYLD